MKIIKPSFKIIEQEPGLQGIYKQIEKAARTCYKSEDKITSDSAKKMVDALINNHHTAMLEHNAVYLKIPVKYAGEAVYDNIEYILNSYTKVSQSFPYNYITTNYRVLVEKDWLKHLQYLCDPTEFHEKRITVKFVCDRALAQELTRHRAFSFAMESQRYCNYSKDKFNKEITFVCPSWINLDKEPLYKGQQSLQEYANDDKEFYYYDDGDMEIHIYVDPFHQDYGFVEACKVAEIYYFKLLEAGLRPEQARAILPNATKTEVVMTGFISDWKYFFKLRTSYFAETGKPHPDMSYLADKLYDEFVNKNYIKDDRKP